MSHAIPLSFVSIYPKEILPFFLYPVTPSASTYYNPSITPSLVTMSSLQSQSTKSSALLVEMDRTHLEDLEKLATMVSDQRNMRHGKRIRSRNKQKKRDPTRIPRPMNCFMAYRLEKQKEIADFCPGANHRDISKIVAKWWKKEPDSVKQKYRVMAEKAKQEHSAM